jgi:hypothetical protein
MHLTSLCMHVLHELLHDVTGQCMQLLHGLCCFDFILDIPLSAATLISMGYFLTLSLKVSSKKLRILKLQSIDVQSAYEKYYLLFITNTRFWPAEEGLLNI